MRLPQLSILSWFYHTQVYLYDRPRSESGLHRRTFLGISLNESTQFKSDESFMVRNRIFYKLPSSHKTDPSWKYVLIDSDVWSRSVTEAWRIKLTLIYGRGE